MNGINFSTALYAPAADRLDGLPMIFETAHNA